MTWLPTPLPFEMGRDVRGWCAAIADDEACTTETDPQNCGAYCLCWQGVFTLIFGYIHVRAGWLSVQGDISYGMRC
jgi:hypothetical protein